MVQLGVPLRLHVLERSRTDDAVADDEHVRLRVAERAESVVVLLTTRIPETKVDGLAIDHDIGAVVVEHRRYVVLREGVGCVCKKEYGFSKAHPKHSRIQKNPK